jgi:hypothetical protein
LDQDLQESIGIGRDHGKGRNQPGELLADDQQGAPYIDGAKILCHGVLAEPWDILNMRRIVSAALGFRPLP